MTPDFEKVEKAKRPQRQVAVPDAYTNNALGDLDRVARYQQIQFREKFSHRFWWLTLCYLTFAVLYVILATTPIGGKTVVQASDTVLVAVLVTTFTQIVSLVYVMAKFIFPDGGVNKE